MDRYEYKLKTEQIQKLVARKEFKAALQVVETIDWRRVRDVKTLSSAAEVYVAARRYEEALDLLEQAYENAPIGRRVIYRLTEVAILAKDAETARSYLDEFKQVAPKDSGQYILEYRLSKLQKESLERRISILEEYQQQEFDERWSYELAKLYAQAGREKDCVKLCDDIILWFSLGKYVDKALALKAKYAPLTASQQDRVSNPEHYKEKLKEVMADSDSTVQEKAETVPEAEAFADWESESSVESESPEELSENAPEEEEPEEEKTASKGMYRLKFPGLSRLFRGGREDVDEDEQPEILTDAVLVDEAAESLPEPEFAEEFGYPSAEQYAEEFEQISPDERNGELTDIFTEAAADKAEEEDAVGTVEDDTADVVEEQSAEPAENEPETVSEAVGTEVQTEDDTEWIADMMEQFMEEEEIPDADTQAAPEEELEQLLHDPSVQTAVETGDVFSAAVRPAEEEPTEAGETDEVLAGQLEFDFLRMDAVARAKEKREKELGIWDDPFRELVMQEPEEEQHIRAIFSSTEEELLRSSQVLDAASQKEREEAEPETAEETEPETEAETASEITEETVPETAEEAVPETIEETAPEIAEEAEPEIAEETAPETEEEAALEEAEETESEAAEEAAPEIAEETVPETAEEAAPETIEEAESEEAGEAEPETIEEAALETEEETVPETAEAVPEEAEETAPEIAKEESEEAEEAQSSAAEAVDELEQAVRLVEAEVHRALSEDELEARQAAEITVVQAEVGFESLEEEQAVPILLEEEPAEENSEEEEPEELKPEEEPDELKPEEEPEEVPEPELSAWSRHNMIVRSDDMRAGFELAMGFLLRLPTEERMSSVARTAGDKLNRKNWEELEERLKGRILIIECANEMDDECLNSLKRYLTGEDHMAVLIDTEENIAEIGLRNKALLDMFPTEYAYYEYSSEEIVHHGLEYAQSLGWSLDDMAMLAYYAAIENMPEVKPGRELIEAENIIDDAIELANQKSIGRLLKGAFGGKKEKGKILREAYFRNH